MTPDFLPISETAVRLGTFVAVLAIMTVWEIAAPRRVQDANRAVRWTSNLGVVIVDAVLVRLLLPTTAIGLAMLAEARGWGLLNLWQVPTVLAVLVAIVVLDFATFLQHVLFHAIPALWRLHRMHHADLAFDVTSGTRFHPFEIVLSVVLRLAVVAALGAPAIAVLIFELVLNASAMFNHSNAYIPPALDRYLRWVVVTPDMHRVHHSIAVHETNSNFGFCLPWWDRMLGTYREQPEAGHQGMTIGIEQFRDGAEQRLDRMLTQPFRGGSDRYGIGDRDGPRNPPD